VGFDRVFDQSLTTRVSDLFKSDNRIGQ
jgi:hypothetical protein